MFKVKDNITFIADGSDGLEIIQMTIKEKSKDINGFSLIGCIHIVTQFIRRIKKNKRNRSKTKINNKDNQKNTFG